MSALTEYPLPEPIQSSDTHDVIDSTKANSFQECPRKYFFEYVLGWRHDKPNIHLEFGSAFHEGMEVLLKNHNDRGMNDPDVIALAFDRFLEAYRMHFSPSDDDKNSPKNPETCLAAYIAYADYYAEKDKHMRVLYTEIAGSVAIRENRDIVFKMDSIVENMHNGEIASWDHKTTGRESSYWGDQFRLGVQAGTYTHSLYSLYPSDKVFGVVMNGVVLRKSGPGFMRYEIRKSMDNMRVWLFNINRIVDEIEFNHRILSESSPDDDVLRAFPQCTTSCTKWGTCPYIAYCEAWSNPLQHCETPPPIFKIEHWDPRTKQDTAKYILEDGKLKEREENVRDKSGAGETEGAIQWESQDKQDARPDSGGKGGWENSYFGDLPPTNPDS